MRNISLKLSALLLLGALFVPNVLSQAQARMQSESLSYSSGFFNELLTLFGRFRNADLQNVFDRAQSIECSDLIWLKGEWRPVAFFNEDRKLGYWCRLSLEEVKADLTVFTFRGSCSEARGKLKVVTKFPVTAAVKAYQKGKVDLSQVDVIENNPVNAVLNAKTKAYTFELPYLFLTNEGSKRSFSFSPPSRNSVYDMDVSSLWECKAVLSKDVTFRFIICRVSTVLKNMRNNPTRNTTFGENAFFVLSDGTEAQTNVKLTFDDKMYNEKPEETPPLSTAPAKPALRRANQPAK
jgi:hypothetical protein